MRSINLSLLGITKQDHAILSVAIKLVDVPGVELIILPDGAPPTGDVILVNADSDAGANYLKQEDTIQTKIIIAENFTLPPLGSRFIERPVRIHDMVNAFNIACERFKSSTTSNIEIGSHSSVAANKRTQAEANNNTPLLLHEFITACTKNSLIKLECKPYSPLFINGISRSVATRATLPEIHIIAKENETRLEMTALSAADEYEQASSSGVNIYPINTVIWHTALVGSTGVILPEHSNDTPVKLKSMPRFPREYMRKRPEFLKMSALLTRKSMTVNQLQQATQLDIKVVTDFYNLIFALGLSTIDETANTAELYQKKKSKNSSLLSRLAKKLSATG